MSITLHTWLSQRPFTLSLSAGFFGFFAHAGVLSALDTARMVPARITGASAGALAGGAWAAGLPGDEFARELFAVTRRDFWDVAPGFGLLRGRLFRERLERILPVSRIERCRVPLAISVFDVVMRQTRALTSGPLARAIHASCAVPGLFHPVMIDGRPHVDGGTVERSPLGCVEPDERVFLHFLASRSPWRRGTGTTLQAPSRTGMRVLVIDNLPRLGPFRLGDGRRAFQMARDALLRQLDQEAPRADATPPATARSAPTGEGARA